jgi:hypothetical protein
MQRTALFITIVLSCLTRTLFAANPVEIVIGDSQYYNEDNVTIDTVESSGSGFSVGAVVTVKGTYTLNSLTEAELGFYSTVSLKDGEKPTPVPVELSQRVEARNGKHSFSLSMVVRDTGNPHLTFYHRKTGKPFGGVYFGDKRNVLMKKGWTYERP